jgi:hypothetical protein
MPIHIQFQLIVKPVVVILILLLASSPVLRAKPVTDSLVSYTIPLIRLVSRVRNLRMSLAINMEQLLARQRPCRGIWLKPWNLAAHLTAFNYPRF